MNDPFARLPAVPGFTVTSTDVTDGQELPSAQMSGAFHVPGGKDLSPQLSRSGAPAETKSYTVTMYDPDAPSGSGFWHWAVADIPASVTELPTGAGASSGERLPSGAFLIPNDVRLTQFIRAHRRLATDRRPGMVRYVGVLDDAIAEAEDATRGLLELAMGGTAVGSGLNAPEGFGEEVAAKIAVMTGAAFKAAANKFTAQGTLDRMVRAHGGLKAAVVTLFKIANDLRWLGSGPRTAIHELIFPANEPGSSIMPGKVNPTQAEAMLMVSIQIIASDVAVTMGGAESQAVSCWTVENSVFTSGSQSSGGRVPLARPGLRASSRART